MLSAQKMNNIENPTIIFRRSENEKKKIIRHSGHTHFKSLVLKYLMSFYETNELE